MVFVWVGIMTCGSLGYYIRLFPIVEPCILSELGTSFDGVKVLIEARVTFEAVHPLLETLKPECAIVPFAVLSPMISLSIHPIT